jgi:hypothetical protein
VATDPKSSFEPVLRVDHARVGRLIRERVFTVDSVFRELLKNSYEAEAEVVDINVDDDGNIEFRDFGKYAGMSDEDVTAFLTIGTQRKSGRRFTEHYKRPIGGEQGIGRISFTQLYRLIEVETEKDGRRVRFRITEDMIDKAYVQPVSLEGNFEALQPTGVNGTTVKCTNLKSGVDKPTPERVRRFIRANFLGVLLNPQGPFKVSVNGEEVKPKVPAGAIPVNVQKRVENVVVKGGRAEDSFITGCILLAGSPVPKEECGIQVSVNGSPIGPRRSLGELVGDRKVDEAISPSRVWGWVEAPFLKYTIGREHVDTNHASYAKFREKMLEVVNDVKAALKMREVEELTRVERGAIEEACRILDEALEAEANMRPMLSVYAHASGGFTSTMTTDRLRPPPPRPPSQESEKRQPSSTPQTRIRKASPGFHWSVREKASWIIEAVAMEDPAALSVRDDAYGIIKVNKANPLYARRARSRRSLRDFLLWVAAYEISGIFSDWEKSKAALSTLLNRLEIICSDQIARVTPNASIV